jgi:predicted negative regulator of RcsB-dependent stress response
VPAISAIALLFVRAAAAQQGQLDASPTLFTVMAAINAAGYDADLDSPNNSPLRKAVRAELARRQIPSLAAIKEFVAKHHMPRETDELGQYISFALTAGPPPDFAIRKRDVDIPPEVMPLRDFPALLAAFYKEAGMADLFQRAQPEIDRLIEPYHDGVLEAVLQVNAYLRWQPSGFQGRRFQVFFEPLAAPSQMHTRSFGNEYTVVITPSPRARIAEVRHAYLYYLLDPLATRNEDILTRKKPLADHALRAKLLGDSYKQDFLLLTTGSLVRAVEARLDHTPQTVQQSLREGYILTPYFYEALPAFEKQELGMLLYYTKMVQSIDVYHEDQRLALVEFAKPVTAAPAAAAAAPAKVTTPPVYETLQQAEALLKQQDPEKAGKLFEDASKQTADRRLQAAGYYGLARIALAQNEGEDAETLLETALSLEPEPLIKAWSLVYLGKLRMEVADRERAARYFQDALRVEGASEAARNEAQAGLQKSAKQ